MTREGSLDVSLASSIILAFRGRWNVEARATERIETPAANQSGMNYRMLFMNFAINRT